MWLLIAFIAVPLIEIALFIQVGGWLGLWPTLGIVVLTAVTGSWLVRSQGLRALASLRSSFSELNDPTEPLANGAMILFSGALLLTPGFFTDLVGFALLIPSVRAMVFNWLKSKVTFASFDMHDSRRHQTVHPNDQVIDGDYEEMRDKPRSSSEPSGWTRH